MTCISKHIAALRKRFERERATLPIEVVELGRACLLHVENYKPTDLPVMRQRALDAIDAFAEAIRS